MHHAFRCKPLSNEPAESVNQVGAPTGILPMDSSRIPVEFYSYMYMYMYSYMYIM